MTSMVWKGVALGIACSLIWGLQAVVSRDAIIHGLTASDVTAIRFFTSGLILLPGAISRRPAIVGQLSWFRAGILTLLVGAPYSLLLVGGLHYAPPIHSGVIFCGLNPLAALAIALVLSTERPSQRKLAGSIVVILGLALFASSQLWPSAEYPHAWIGDLLFASAAICFATLGNALARWKLSPADYLSPVCVLSLASLPLWGLGVLFRLSAVDLGTLVVQAFYQGVVVGLLSYFLFTKCVALLGPFRAALFTPMIPIATALSSWLVLREPPTWIEAVGTLLVVGGMLIGLTGAREPGGPSVA